MGNALDCDPTSRVSGRGCRDEGGGGLHPYLITVVDNCCMMNDNILSAMKTHFIECRNKILKFIF